MEPDMFHSPTAETLVGNIRTAAEAMGTSTRTVQRRTKDGDFPSRSG
jgi:hypothetical protein